MRDGQHLEVEVVDIAPGLGDVAGVDHQDVGGGELVEPTNFDVLHLLPDDVDPMAVAGPEDRVQPIRVRLDERQGRRFVEKVLGGVQHHRRREAGSDLDDPSGLLMTHVRVEDPGVGEPVHTVLGAEAKPFDRMRPIRRKIVVVLRQRMQDLDLSVQAQIDAWELARGRVRPDPLGVSFHLRNRHHR